MTFRCFKCQAEIAYYDSETHRAFDANEMPHTCQSRPIPLYQMINDIPVRHSEAYIAKMITDEQLRLGLRLDRPYKREYRGDNLYIS